MMGLLKYLTYEKCDEICLEEETSPVYVRPYIIFKSIETDAYEL